MTRSALFLCLLISLTALAGCGRYAVRPDEKEFLADRIMQAGWDPEETAIEQHTLTNREAAQGGFGAGGGGCGCN